MLGLSPRQALERYDRVIDFAGLREFEELKLKNYSSGMHVRLAFSVMIQVDADILMIDEVLAVGDAAFQQKCFDVFNRLREEGRTILFVTHDMGSVRRFCHRAMLLDRGDVKMIGKPLDVGTAYVDLNFRSDTGASVVEGERTGDRSADLLEAWWEDEAGERQTTLPQGKAFSFRARVRFSQPVEDPRIAVVFENDQGLPLLATSTEWAKEHTGAFGAGDEALFSVNLEMAFAPGRIYASPWVDQGEGGRLMDRRPRLTTALVTGPYQTGGLVDLPHDVRLEAPSGSLAGAMRL
jgi:energy-coupling factor transporter ATP-binding protein EcfA2